MMLAPDELPVTANTCMGTCGKEEANALKNCCPKTIESFIPDNDDSTGNEFESATDEAIPGVKEWPFKNFHQFFTHSPLLENVFPMYTSYTTGLYSYLCHSL